MRKTLITALFMAATLINGAQTPAQTADVNDIPALAQSAVSITGVNWYLLEIKTPARTITLDRAALETDGMGNVFSIQFAEKKRVFGTGAPNKYNAPCEWGKNSTLTIGTIASTMMLAFKEPEALKENEFFKYLEKVSMFRVNAEGRLELILARESKDDPRTVMVFAREK